MDTRGRLHAHILTMRDGGWRVRTLICAWSGEEGWLVGWLAGRLVGRSVGRLVGRLMHMLIIFGGAWLPGGDEHRPIPPCHRRRLLLLLLLLYPELSVHHAERNANRPFDYHLSTRSSNLQTSTIAWIKLNRSL